MVCNESLTYLHSLLDPSNQLNQGAEKPGKRTMRRIRGKDDHFMSSGSNRV